MFGRIARVELEDAGGRMTAYEGLDVRFTVTYQGTIYDQSARIGILGLPRDVNERYASVFWFRDWESRRRVRLYAGYADRQQGKPILLFEGKATSASLTPAPDVWLNLTAMSDVAGDSVTRSYVSQKTMSVKDFAAEVCAQFGIRFVWLGDSSAVDAAQVPAGTILRDVTKQAMLTALSRAIPSYAKIKCWFRYFDIESDKSNTFVGCPAGEAPSLSGFVSKQQTPVFTDSDVIGIPTMTWPNLSATTFLRPDLSPMMGVKFAMEHFKFGSDTDYWITKLVHSGQVRSGAWQTTMFMQPLSVATTEGRT